MGNRLCKIVVTDNAGIEHIFNESTGDIEHYLDLRPLDVDDTPIPGAVKITTRTFGGGKNFTTESKAYFFNPTRVDVLYDAD